MKSVISATNTLKNLNLFKNLSTEELKFITDSCEIIHLKRNQTLIERYTPASEVYILIAGSLQLSIKEGSMHSIINFLLPSEVVGISLIMMNDAVYLADIVANETSTVLKMNKSNYERIFIKNPILFERIQRQIADRIHDLHFDKLMMKRSVPERLALVLLRFLEKQPSLWGTQIMIRLQRGDLAKYIGAEPETIIRILKKWTLSGWINTEEHKIQILDLGSLKKIAYEHGNNTKDSGTRSTARIHTQSAQSNIQ